MTVRESQIDEKKIEAIREIEDIEDELQHEDHGLADDLSDARIKLNSALIVEAVGDLREEGDEGDLLTHPSVLLEVAVLLRTLLLWALFIIFGWWFL